MTTTGVVERCTQCWLVEPKRMPANAPTPRLPTTSRPAPGSVDEDLCRVTFGHPHHRRDGSFGAEDLLDDLLQLLTRASLSKTTASVPVVQMRG